MFKQQQHAVAISFSNLLFCFSRAVTNPPPLKYSWHVLTHQSALPPGEFFVHWSVAKECIAVAYFCRLSLSEQWSFHVFSKSPFAVNKAENMTSENMAFQQKRSQIDRGQKYCPIPTLLPLCTCITSASQVNKHFVFLLYPFSPFKTTNMLLLNYGKKLWEKYEINSFSF